MKKKQKVYGMIEVDNSQEDIVQIWNKQVNKKEGDSTVELVQVEKKNVPWLINMLQSTL
jgi:L-rhamnose mutarotase